MQFNSGSTETVPTGEGTTAEVSVEKEEQIV